MLSSLLVAFAAAQVPTDTPQPPVMPDWRYEFAIFPPSSTLTEEWVCEFGTAGARIAIRITDVGRDGRNKQFSAELLEIQVGGREPKSGVVDQVKRVLGSLTHIESVRGMCRHTAPALQVQGFEYDGKKYTPKSVIIDLR